MTVIEHSYLRQTYEVEICGVHWISLEIQHLILEAVHEAFVKAYGSSPGIGVISKGAENKTATLAIGSGVGSLPEE